MRFQSTKAIHAAAVLTRQESRGAITRLRLLKLLYIADRTMLERRGRPLLRANAAALDNGPLHSEVYNLIKGVHLDAPEWDKHFHAEGPRTIVMHDEPAPGSLSEYEIKLLIEVSESHSHLDDWELVEKTHEFKEWKDHRKEGTSRPIPLKAMIDAVGRSDESDEILEELEAAEGFDRLLGSA